MPSVSTPASPSPRGFPSFGVTVVLAAQLASCGPSPTPETAADRSCAPPEGADAVTLPAVGSRLGLQIALSEAHLQRELARQVPRVLASAKNQSMGAAGRVSYTITRGDFSITTPPGALQVTTQLTGDIDTCKPIGPFCVAYGACEPRWSVELRLPTDFDRELALQVSTHVGVTQGCVLRPVGYDATPELERITRQEARSVRQRIRSELARAERQLVNAWDRWQRPMQLPNGDCWKLSVDEIGYAPPQLENGVLRAGVEALGQVGFGCSAESPATESPASESPELQNDVAPEPIGVTRSTNSEPSTGPRITARPELSPRIAWSVPVAWSLDELERALAANTGRSVRLRAVASSSGEDPPNNTLYLSFDPDATCPNWRRATPRVSEAQLLIELAENGATPSEKLALPLPNQMNAVQSGLEHLQVQLAEALEIARDQGVELQLELAHHTRVDVDHQALRLVQSLEGTARVVSGR